MNFDLTDEQRLLRDSVERMLAGTYDAARRATYAAEPGGFSRDMWRRLAEQGLLALPFPEDEGGVGGGAVETGIVMEAFGRRMTLEPFLPSVVLAGTALKLAGSPGQRASAFGAIASGEHIFAVAHDEPDSRYDLADVQAKARRDGPGWRLDGRKARVLNGDAADTFIVSARTSGDRFDEDGIGLFLVEHAAPGLLRQGYTALDSRRGADLELSHVEAVPLGDPSGGFAVLERMREAGIAAVASEAVGLMDEMVRVTVEYLKTRRQFGKLIGEFQVLRHRAVDMLVAAEQSRSMADFAAASLDLPGRDERRAAFSAVKVYIGQSLRFVSQNAVQLHGGIGVTEECAVGQHFKRATVLELMFGDTDHHLARFAEHGGFLAPDLGSIGLVAGLATRPG